MNSLIWLTNIFTTYGEFCTKFSSFFALYPNPIFFLPPRPFMRPIYVGSRDTCADARRINAQNTFIPNRLMGENKRFAQQCGR